VINLKLPQKGCVPLVSGDSIRKLLDRRAVKVSTARQINENSLARHAIDWHDHPQAPVLLSQIVVFRGERKETSSVSQPGSLAAVLLGNENIKNIFRLSGPKESHRTDRCRKGKGATQWENKSASRNPQRCLWTGLCKFRRLFYGFSAEEKALKLRHMPPKDQV